MKILTIGRTTTAVTKTVLTWNADRSSLGGATLVCFLVMFLSSLFLGRLSALAYVSNLMDHVRGHLKRLFTPC